MAKIIDNGLAKADSPIFQSGWTTRFVVRSKKTKTPTVKRILDGLRNPSDPRYKEGWMITTGRNSKPTAEDKKKNGDDQ
tara:strand:- start:139 stop:375 length:237 start_codon:yes stop_codon:yes gene_type:complete